MKIFGRVSMGEYSASTHFFALKEELAESQYFSSGQLEEMAEKVGEEATDGYIRFASEASEAGEDGQEEVADRFFEAYDSMKNAYTSLSPRDVGEILWADKVEFPPESELELIDTLWRKK